METINDKIVIFLNPKTIEPAAKQQLENIAELPFVFKHVPVMPDCHLGKGATVGSVIATKGAIIPAAGGVDIGCGMIAVRPNSSRKICRIIWRRSEPESNVGFRSGLVL